MATMTPKRKTRARISGQQSTPVEPLPNRHPLEEAPDRGEASPEAAEDRLRLVSEAPDAGEGRAALLEHEFTHGRSQS